MLQMLHHQSQPVKELQMPRNRHKNLARAMKHQTVKKTDFRLAKKIDAALSGCSERSLKAISSTDYKMCLRKKLEPDYGPVCLPDVSLYAARYRGNKPVTAR